MRVLLGTKNLAVIAVNTSAKTLTVTGLNGQDFAIPDLVCFYDVTTTTVIPLQSNITNVTNTINNDGTETTVYFFSIMPNGISNTDTFNVYMNVPLALATYYSITYQASKV